MSPGSTAAEFEADDLIGTLAARMRAEGLRCTIVTRDKDMAQLITPGDVYWDYSRRHALSAR